MANEKRLIDAKLLLEYLGEEPYIWTDTDAEIQEHSDWLRFKEMIERQPTVDAAPVVHGRWEDVFKGEYAWKRYKCPVCREYALYRHEQDVLGKWKTVQVLANYCPNCGAKMDQKEDE